VFVLVIFQITTGKTKQNFPSPGMYGILYKNVILCNFLLLVLIVSNLRGEGGLSGPIHVIVTLGNFKKITNPNLTLPYPTSLIW